MKFKCPYIGGIIPFMAVALRGATLSVDIWASRATTFETSFAVVDSAEARNDRRTVIAEGKHV